MKKEMTRDEFREAYRAYIGKTKYGKGGFGQALTLVNLNILRSRYPAWYNKRCPLDTTKTWYGYLLTFCDKGWFIADCIGLIKGIRAGFRADGTLGKLTREIDQTCEAMVRDLEDVTDYEKADADCMVFFSDYSHAMIVSEKGKRDVESAPSLDGVQEVKLTYQPASRVGGAGKLPWVDYGEGSEEVKYNEFKVCRKGSRGDAVRTIQAIVHVFVDGVFGKDTDAAVKAFQKKNGLVVDGIVGEKTWEALMGKLK